VGANAKTEVFQVCGEERQGRVVQWSLPREDDALGLAPFQPGGPKKAAEVAANVVLPRSVGGLDEGGQLGLLESQLDLDRPGKEHRVRLLTL